MDLTQFGESPAEHNTVFSEEEELPCVHWSFSLCLRAPCCSPAGQPYGFLIGLVITIVG
jgi:hypothetical protein